MRAKLVGTIPTVRGDRERLRQVMQNLVDNAVKYSSAGGEVRVVASAFDGLIRVDVEDAAAAALVLERAAKFARTDRAKRALANLAEVYRLLTVYGLADSVLLDLGEVRGFDYYSGVHFEAYVTGLGAPLVGGGRYDQMLARFGYDCPATGFAVEVGRALLAMDSQGASVLPPGPDFFIIDFTADKTRALALSRRFRDLDWAVARDIISRPLPESLTYARQQRAHWAIVIGGDPGDADQLRVLDLAAGTERGISVADLLSAPTGHFPELKEHDHV